jgi:hypothetical protein
MATRYCGPFALFSDTVLSPRIGSSTILVPESIPLPPLLSVSVIGTPKDRSARDLLVPRASVLARIGFLVCTAANRLEDQIVEQRCADAGMAVA